jgi:hypothetical protein
VSLLLIDAKLGLIAGSGTIDGLSIVAVMNLGKILPVANPAGGDSHDVRGVDAKKDRDGT